ncbi:biopolymer transporter ExbD [bacterium]|nr:biopolymer transporter ExbD [bacterium]
MILRLIDIVLIVLFGFISMATIENQRKLELAETETVRTPDISTEGNVTISVDVWGDIFFQDERESWDLVTLERYLSSAGETSVFGDSLHIRVRADEGAPMGQVKKVIQAADRHDLARSLIVVYHDQR